MAQCSYHFLVSFDVTLVTLATGCSSAASYNPHAACKLNRCPRLHVNSVSTGSSLDDGRVRERKIYQNGSGLKFLTLL